MPDTDFKNRKHRLIKHLNCPTVICGGSKMKKTKNKKKKGGEGANRRHEGLEVI